jgi:DNA-binding SARP family transcriptional activator
MSASARQEDLASTDPVLAARSARRRPAPDRPPLRFISLGGFRVLSDGVEIPNDAVGRERARQLLAALLCTRRSVDGEELHEWLWPELEAHRASRALGETASELRRGLEPYRQRPSDPSVIVSGSGTYRVELFDGDSWDVEEVLRAADPTALPPGPEERVGALGAALEASRAEPYPEWPYDEWAAELRRECARASLAIRASLAEALLAAERPEDARVHFSVLADEEPEQEGWHRGIMRCHSAAGERALALRQFHTCRSVLRQSRGVEPSPETQALYIELLKARSGGG